ncbi:MAG: transposase [bacterium]|nr:transposase [bacterium]
MRERIIRRYSACFKQQVVADLENGRFESIQAARQHYDIGGKTTIQKWLRRYGKNHLQAKVVRVEKPDEADRIRQLKRQIAQLQRALGQTQAENVLNAEYLKLACDELGKDVEGFKKKSDGGRSTEPQKDQN